MTCSRKIHTAIIGAGTFGMGIVTQASRVPEIEITGIADLNLENAKRAYSNAGISKDNAFVCEDRRSALAAIESGRFVITEDPLLLMELPIDIIVEATGAAEAATHHTYEAIRHGKHVVMVTKEADAAVGPILKYLADKAGVVYTPADGDQHGLLIRLISWARAIGLEVICGGKAQNGELLYDPTSKTVSGGRNSIILNDEDLWMVEAAAADSVQHHIMARNEKLADFTRISVGDVSEMTIAANASGLHPEEPSLHRLPLYISEIPKILCLSRDGGILKESGAVDEVICLRYPHEAGLGGGVFIVVGSENEYSRGIISGGLPAQSIDRHAFLITRPYHLRGVETLNTILAAGSRDTAAGEIEYLPRYDVVLKTNRDLKAGETLKESDAEASIVPSQRLDDRTPLSAYMAIGNRLSIDVAKGEIITSGMIVPPPGSILWSLRNKQDEYWGGKEK